MHSEEIPIQNKALDTRIPPQIIVLLSIISVQLGAAVGKSLFSMLGPVGTVFLRLGFSALLLLAVWRPQLHRLTRKQYLLIFLFGASVAIMNASFYSAIARIPLGVAVTLEFVGPLGVALIQSRKLQDGVWALLAAAGIILLAPIGQTTLDPLGIGLALLAGLFWGAYILLNVHIGRSFSGGTGLSLSLAVATIVVAPLGILSGGSTLLKPQALLFGLFVAVLSTVIPFSLELEALRRLPSRVFGVLMSIEPAVAAIIGFLVLREAIGVREIAAIALIVTASVGVSLEGKQAL